MSNANLPAMPQPHADNLCQQTGTVKAEHAGLTKREMFAMAAMQGLCANSIVGSHYHTDKLSKYAVMYADALLAELERTK